MKFDIPIVEKMYMERSDNPRNLVFSGGTGFAGLGDISLFNKKGEIKNKDGVNGLIQFILEIVEQSRNNRTGGDDW